MTQTPAKDWTLPYRIVEARSRGKICYATCATREEIAAWLDTHAEWMHTYSSDHQTRVLRTSPSTALQVYTRVASVDTEGSTITRWVPARTMTDLIGRITPGHEHSAAMA